MDWGSVGHKLQVNAGVRQALDGGAVGQPGAKPGHDTAGVLCIEIP